VTVTLALPTPVAVTTPALLTVRTLLLDDENVTFLFVALGGKTIIGSLRVVPFLPFASTVKAELCAGDSVPNLTDETGTAPRTETVAVCPFGVLAVITAVPGATALMLPLASTVAILLLEEVHVIFLIALRQT